MSDEALYLRAILTPDHEEQLQVFREFIVSEMSDASRRLEDLTDDEGAVPEQHAPEWSRQKGRLDTLRLVHGMIVQACLQELHGELTADVTEPPADAGVDVDDEDEDEDGGRDG